VGGTKRNPPPSIALGLGSRPTNASPSIDFACQWILAAMSVEFLDTILPLVRR
jgi:hypothetical protein